jgi:hypothetical protein
MNLGDYIIDQKDKNWSELLAPWAPILPQKFTVFLINRFGDVFMIYEDESVHMLDVSVCTVSQIAENRNDFADKMNIDKNANDWLMIPLVDQCVAAGMKPSATQCYSYRISPLLGGGYSSYNIALIALAEHYAFHADLYRQTKDLPDGSKVKIVIENAASSTFQKP